MKKTAILSICTLIFLGTSILLIVSSCQKSYDVKVSFWFNKEMSDMLVSDSVTELNILYDDRSQTDIVYGKTIGSIAVTDWKTGADCEGANFTKVIKIDGSSKKSAIRPYEVYDQNGNKLFSGKMVVSSKACTNIELKW